MVVNVLFVRQCVVLFVLFCLCALMMRKFVCN